MSRDLLAVLNHIKRIPHTECDARNRAAAADRCYIPERLSYSSLRKPNRICKQGYKSQVTGHESCVTRHASHDEGRTSYITRYTSPALTSTASTLPLLPTSKAAEAEM